MPSDSFSITKERPFCGMQKEFISLVKCSSFSCQNYWKRFFLSSEIYYDGHVIVCYTLFGEYSSCQFHQHFTRSFLCAFERFFYTCCLKFRIFRLENSLHWTHEAELACIPLCQLRERGPIMRPTRLQLKRFNVQWSPVNRITLGQHNSDNNNRMIQLTDMFCVLLRYKWVSKSWWQ